MGIRPGCTYPSCDCHGQAGPDGTLRSRCSERTMMQIIHDDNEQSERGLGWWGRLMLRKFGHIEKPPFLPWIPSCYANLIEGTIVFIVALTLVYLVLRGATSCS